MSALQNPQELEFTELGLKQGNLIIVQPYPFDLQKMKKLKLNLSSKN
jgi:hypothetical protein